MRALLLILALAGCAPQVAEVGGPLVMQVEVVDFGYHTVIAVEGDAVRAHVAALSEDADIARLAIALQDHEGAPWLEFGWGDAEVFPNAATISELEIGVALRAVLFPTPALMQIAPYATPPYISYGGNDRVVVGMSAEGFDAMLRGFGAALAEPVVAVLPGFTTDALFYPAVQSYHAARTCNTWVVDRLREAGTPLRGGILTSGGTMRALRRAENVSEPLG